MTQPVSRRNALGMFSTIGLGALLASCTRGGDGVSSALTTEATVETVEGGTAPCRRRRRERCAPSPLPPPTRPEQAPAGRLSRRCRDRDGPAGHSQPTLSKLMGDSQVPDLPSPV